MKYAVMSNVNGAFFIDSEWTDNLAGARQAFWNRCEVLDAAPDVVKAAVMVVNENLDVADKRKEIIDHTPAPEPEE